MCVSLKVGPEGWHVQNPKIKSLRIACICPKKKHLYDPKRMTLRVHLHDPESMSFRGIMVVFST